MDINVFLCGSAAQLAWMYEQHDACAFGSNWWFMMMAGTAAVTA
jgi:hypothetical protein